MTSRLFGRAEFGPDGEWLGDPANAPGPDDIEELCFRAREADRRAQATGHPDTIATAHHWLKIANRWDPDDPAPPKTYTVDPYWQSDLAKTTYCPPGPGLSGSPFPEPPPEPRVGLAFTRAPTTGLAPGCLHLRPATGARQNPKE